MTNTSTTVSPLHKSFDMIFANMPPTYMNALKAEYGKPSADCFWVISRTEIATNGKLGKQGLKMIESRLEQTDTLLWDDDKVSLQDRISIIYPGGVNQVPAQFYRFHVPFNTTVDDLLVAIGEQEGELTFFDLLMRLERLGDFRDSAVEALSEIGNTNWSATDIRMALSKLNAELTTNISAELARWMRAVA